jgi:type IV secretion system protein VirD4
MGHDSGNPQGRFAMTGIIVGKYGNRYLTSKKEHFILLAAPTGSDKGVACVLPNLLHFADSVVVFDLKLENFRITSAYRQRHGQRVFLFAPFSRDRKTHRWNPLDAVSRDPLHRVGDILAIGQVLYPGDCDPREKFWNDTARNVFLGFVLYLLETPGLPCTLGEVFRQSSGKGRQLKSEIEERLMARADSSNPLSDQCTEAFGRFLAAPENTLGNIITTFNAPLLVFANPLVDAATSASDFDVSELRRHRISLYVGVQPENLGDAAILVNLLFSQIIGANTSQLPETDPQLRYRCLLILDEFTALGKIGVIARSSAYIRAFNLVLLTIVQSISQLESVYGIADARSVIANHRLHILFAPHEQREANEYSERLGFRTVKAKSTNATVQTAWGQPNSRSESVSEQRRALLLPQELKELPDGRQIISAAGTRPILCEKARYYLDRRFMDRLAEASPYLARLATAAGCSPWKRLIHWVLRPLPSEAQLKHAAFVLKELSADITELALAGPGRASVSALDDRAEQPDYDLKRMETRAHELPSFADSNLPTNEELSSLVDTMMTILSESEPVVRRPVGAPGGRRGKKTAPVPLNAIECADDNGGQDGNGGDGGNDDGHSRYGNHTGAFVS